MSTPFEALRKTELLASLDEGALVDMAQHGRLQRYARGERIVSELEFGADVYVIVSGEAEISIEPRAGERQVLGKLGPGGLVGEMASLTGELRSATVTATGDLEALVIPDRDFDELRERRPEIAVALVRKLAARLAEAERSIDTLLTTQVSTPPKAAAKKSSKGSITRVWRELVVDRSRDLAFLTLAAFVITLLVIRGVVFASFTWDIAPRGVLRAAYMTGFALLGSSACAALLTFRPGWRRAIAIAYGIGCALIFNELGVTLAFDIFFKDIHTPDPNVAFDVEQLYRRTAPMRAITIGLVVLIQAAYLRRFYARVWFVVKTRIRRLLSR
ncbi:MAG TPA: cyclic nucleotide-binding domain-containing protein [Polyangiaceae bacterium]